jgi:hypothetical protein
MLLDLLTGQRVLLAGLNGVLPVTEEDIGDMSASLVLNATAGVTIKIASSDNTADVAAGTGAQKVLLFGLDATGKWQTDELTMNGQTPVVSAKTWGLAGGLPILGADVSQAGTGGKNAGIICVVENGVTITTGASGDMTKTYALIPIGAGKSSNAFYQVPTGERFEVHGVHFSTSLQSATFYLRIHQYGAPGGGQLIPVGSVGPNAAVSDVDLLDHQMMLTEKTIVRLVALAAVAGASVMGMVELRRCPVPK